MDIDDLLEHLNQEKMVEAGSQLHLVMIDAAQEALKITAELNGPYHTPEVVRELFAQLIGKPVDPSFAMFPPFYTDCGENITVGRMSSSTQAAVSRTRAESGLVMASSSDTMSSWLP